MANIEKKLQALGLVLPPPVKPPAGVVLPFQFVRLVGTRAYISGHGPQNPDGTIAAPLGKVGRDITIEQGLKCKSMQLVCRDNNQGVFWLKPRPDNIR